MNLTGTDWPLSGHLIIPPIAIKQWSGGIKCCDVFIMRMPKLKKQTMTTENLEKVKLLARDLRDEKQFPRSPRSTLAGYVLAARAVDKCRAVLVDWQGEYHSNCPLDQRWLNFAEIDYGDFRSLVATAATDDEIAAWIEKNAKKRPRAEIVAWNNKERDLRLSDLPHDLQEYMENYIHRYVPRNRVVYHWFDVYDLEEQRI
jgi:hypothetical protein